MHASSKKRRTAGSGVRGRSKQRRGTDAPSPTHLKLCTRPVLFTALARAAEQQATNPQYLDTDVPPFSLPDMPPHQVVVFTDLPDEFGVHTVAMCHALLFGCRINNADKCKAVRSFNCKESLPTSVTNPADMTRWGLHRTYYRQSCPGYATCPPMCGWKIVYRLDVQRGGTCLFSTYLPMSTSSAVVVT